MLSSRTDQVDELVLAVFDATRPPVSVLAVGGYGRRELFPFSDVDLLLLVDSPPGAPQREAIAAFLRQLWDAGIRVSHSVHTPAECCEIHDGNLELTISLLDQRFLCGDQTRYDSLSRLFPRFLTAERGDVVHHLAVMTQGRHAKYGNTIHHLEPNVKEHPGGLRDLQVIHWLQQLRNFEADPLDDARAFLFDVRTKLHEYFGRDNNVLTFEAQESLSPQPAEWMREYYWNARQIDRATARALDVSEKMRNTLIGQFRDWRSRLSTTEFTVARGQVLLRNPALLEADPTIFLQLMRFIARHQLPLAPDTETRLAKLTFPVAPWTELRELLLLPQCTNALRAMADLGQLQQMIPGWSHIDCLVVRDFYHRYTVDEHTFVALQALETLATTKDPAHFAGLLSEIDRVDLLRFALLLHDLGKGEGTGEHSARSVEIAREAIEQLHVPQADADTVLFLVEHHLDLSSLMLSRDLNDPVTAKQVADTTGTIERLKLLTLLTYADISAVNPGAMTPWRAEQLWKTYLIGSEEFTRELATDRIHAPASLAPDAAGFLDGLPTRYLKTHTGPQIAGHLELLRAGNAVHLARTSGSWRLTVAADDRPGLLAAISGALASFGMNILKAEVFTNSRGQALDTFTFADPHRTLELNPDEGDNLQDVVLRAIAGKIDVAKLIGKRRKLGVKARVDPRVTSTNDVSQTSTLFEIVAQDRAGLLFELTQAIATFGANIEVVLVDTEAHRALDVFYVRLHGGKLPDSYRTKLQEKLLEVCRI